MNISSLFLLVLFSFMTDVKINIHILYHNKQSGDLQGNGGEGGEGREMRMQE